MIPFHVQFRSGVAAQHQVVYAAKKAVATGVLRPGDRFPSVRSLSHALKINPNTAQKVVANLKQAGILAVRPGIGTIVADTALGSPEVRSELLEQVERLVVNACLAGLSRDELHEAVEEHWQRLSPPHGETDGVLGNAS